MVIRPVTTPILSFRGLTNGARQLVVHEALEITVSDALSTSWFTPNTTVASTSLPPGAEMMTFLAPPLRWAEAFSFVVKKPVHSSTTSTFSSPQGNSAGLRFASTRILSPLTTMQSPSTPTVPGNFPGAVSYWVRWALVLGSPKSLIATIWMSCFLPPS